MSVWSKEKLGNHCEITSSKRIFFSEYVENGIPFYRSKEIIEKSQGREISEPLFISQQKFNDIRNKYGIPLAGDMLLTSVGTIGIPYIVKPNDEFYFKDGNLTWFRNFDAMLSSQFLRYWIGSSEGYSILNNSTIGSSQKALTISALCEIECPLPPIGVQEHIVAILSAYDDLIEANQRQIKLLEEAAQRLYKEWFVDLRYPGHENVPVVDGVPERWKKQRLEEIATVIMGQSPKSEFYNLNQEGLPFHQGVGSYGYRFVIDGTYSTSFTRIAPSNSILFSVRAPVGRLNITKNKIVIGRGLAAMNHRDGMQSFLFYLLKNRFFKEDMVGNGSIFASISKDELLGQAFLIPPNNLVARFNQIASHIDEQISALDTMMKLQSEARDRLLPKLMSGDITI